MELLAKSCAVFAVLVWVLGPYIFRLGTGLAFIWYFAPTLVLVAITGSAP